VLPCVLAISRQSKGQRAQAKEAEAEKLRLSLRYLDGSSFQSFLSVFTQVLRKSWRKVTGKLAGFAIFDPPGESKRVLGALWSGKEQQNSDFARAP